MPIPTAGAAVPGPAHRGFWRRGALTAAICVLIAGGLTLAGGRFGAALVYSGLIGVGCWLAVDGGRLLGAAWLARRHPDDPAARQGWPGWPFMLGLIGLGVPLVYVAGHLAAAAILGHAVPRPADWAARGGAVVTLLVSVAVSLAITLWFFVRERLALLQARADAADRLALHSQLRLLQSQLEPHMLFNTLANLRVLIGLDPSRAQAMLDRLIALLRATLDGSRRDAHPLAAEFDRLADYLELMKVRMGPRLAVTTDLPPALRDRLVPPLLLQPLVENAIRHGLEPKREGGRLALAACRRDDDGLRLTVRDTGVGLAAVPAAADAPDGGGYGTRHVHERLRALYGNAARFTLAPAGDAEGGTLAVIDLPPPGPGGAAAPGPAR